MSLECLGLLIVFEVGLGVSHSPAVLGGLL